MTLQEKVDLVRTARLRYIAKMKTLYRIKVKK